MAGAGWAAHHRGMTAPERERWLGPVPRDGRWWMVSDDGRRVAHTEGEAWRQGWPPGRLDRGLGWLLAAALLVLPLAVLGTAIVTGRVCAIPECGYGALVAVQAPAATDGLPVVYAAPCSREPVDSLTVSVPPLYGDHEGEEVYRLVREPGTGVVTRFALGGPVPGYREAAGRPVEVLRAAYRAGLDDPAAVHRVTVRYADGSVSSEGLGVAGDLPGSLRLHTWGDQTLEQFAADASVEPVCLRWIEEPGHALRLSLLGWAALAVAVTGRRLGRRRYAAELVRTARATAAVSPAASGRG